MGLRGAGGRPIADTITIREEGARTPRLYRSEPQWRVRGLRRQDVRDVRALNVLVVERAGVERRILARFWRTVDIHREACAVPHDGFYIPQFNQSRFNFHRRSPRSFFHEHDTSRCPFIKTLRSYSILLDGRQGTFSVFMRWHSRDASDA